jgi:Holliday junction resolvasome RuvABC DNA-binding subunit
MDPGGLQTIRRESVLKPGAWHPDDEGMKKSLLDVTGVGPATARLLDEAGFSSVASIANAEPGALAMVRGIGPVRAVSLQIEAQQLLAGSELVSAAVASAEPSKRQRRAKRLRKQAKQLRKQAKMLAKKAESSKSKKKRKRRLREAAELEAAAKKARRDAKKLLAD